MTGETAAFDELVALNGSPPPPAVPADPATVPETGVLLDTIAATVEKFVVLPDDHARVAVPLWALHTWAVDAAWATPYLLVVSPEKRSGKSRLLEVLALLTRKPWCIAAASEAAMFRKIHESRPTLLLDEIDAIFGAASERTEPLRAILNSGNRPGAAVARCVGDGANQQVVDFSVFCPKVLSGIDTGRVPDTIVDRSIRLPMKRKTPGEQVEKFRHRYAVQETASIREAAEAWGATHTDELYAAEPVLPAGLDDRAGEAWEPLLAIADHAGGTWPALAREAALGLVGDDTAEPGHGARLLAKLYDVFADAEALATTAILEAVNDDDELPFGGWRKGDGLDARGLSRLLKPYGVRPRSVRIDGATSTSKGYRREQLAEAFERYLPPAQSPAQAAQAAQPAPRLERDVPDVPDVPDKSGGVAEAATEAEEAEIERIRAKLEDGAA
jgi:hypothetical protein